MYSYKKVSDGGTQEVLACYKSDKEMTDEVKNIFGDDKTFNNFIKNPDKFHISNHFLNDDNNHTVENCQEEAKKHYSTFFLVNDLRYDTVTDVNKENNIQYTCTIPKNDIIYRPIQKEATDRSNIFSYLISPINDFIDNIFNGKVANLPTKEILKNTAELESYLRNDDSSKDEQCVIFNNNSKKNTDLNAFGGKDSYVIYNTKFINNKDKPLHLQLKRTLNEYNTFNNQINLANGGINTAFFTFLKNVRERSRAIKIIRQSVNEATKEKDIDEEIKGAKADARTLWHLIFNPANENSLLGYYQSIHDDTDVLNNANRHYLDFIDAIEDEIKKEKKIFNKLKLSKNGNNAKLHDTNFLKQIKIIEIIFLIIIPIIVLFLIIKKK